MTVRVKIIWEGNYASKIDLIILLIDHFGKNKQTKTSQTNLVMLNLMQLILLLSGSLSCGLKQQALTSRRLGAIRRQISVELRNHYDQ